MTETEFQGQVVDLANLLGWRHLHIRRSIGKGNRWTTTTNLIGWPDLLLMHARHGWVAAELKIPPNTATPAQSELLGFLGAMPACQAFLWTPAHWTEIQAVLSGRGPVAGSTGQVLRG